MSGFFFTAPIPTQDDIENKINDALTFLKKNEVSDETSAFFRQLLNARMAEFQQELGNMENNSAEKDLILQQYNRFARGLYGSMHSPSSTSSNITSYHNYRYYPVHIKDIEKPNPTTQKLMVAAVAVGSALLTTAAVTFVFNPVIAAILLAVALTCLLPTGLYYITPDSKDTAAKKAEESLIFQEGAKLINPQIKCNGGDIQNSFELRQFSGLEMLTNGM